MQKKSEYMHMPKKKYQCFISSTYDDLREERATGIDAILDADQIPAGMEYFEAGRPQKEIIEKWMDRSDLVIFILGGRYGTIDAKTGNGYTEDEFDYAIKTDKPHFSIILSKLYLKKKETDFLQKNLNISMYEKDNVEKYKAFIEKVHQDGCEEVNSIEEIKSAILKNILRMIQTGKMTGGWVECDKYNDTNINKINLAERDRVLTNLIREHLTYSSNGVDEQKIAEKCYGVFQRYHQSLKKYMTTMAYSIEIKLFDDYIEEHSIANKTYKLAENASSIFLYDPWLYEGMESETFEIENLKYNSRIVDEKYIKRGNSCHTENPFYVKDVIKVEFPFDENQEFHRVQYSTRHRIQYDRYFHEYVFKEFCMHLSLMVSLQDCRTQKNEKEYLLKWELFTPYEKYDYLSQNTVEYSKDKLNLNVMDLLFPGNGYIITLNSVPGFFDQNNKKYNIEAVANGLYNCS